MSATNAIHGIVLVGAIVVVGRAWRGVQLGPLLTTLAVAAVVLGALNVFGGFAVTERMLQMFRPQRATANDDWRVAIAPRQLASRSRLFIFGLHYLSSPTTARLGNRLCDGRHGRSRSSRSSCARRASDGQSVVAGVVIGAAVGIYVGARSR